VSADDDPGPPPRQRPDDVPQSRLARHRLEPPVRKQRPQSLSEFPQLGRPGGPLPDLHLPPDEPPGALGIEAIDGKPAARTARPIIGAAASRRAKGERAHQHHNPRKPPAAHGVKCAALPDGRPSPASQWS
jgi:hypothetical protein